LITVKRSRLDLHSKLTLASAVSLFRCTSTLDTLRPAIVSFDRRLLALGSNRIT